MSSIGFFTRKCNGYFEYLIPSKSSQQKEIKKPDSYNAFKSPLETNDHFQFFSLLATKICHNKKAMGIPVWDVAEYIHLTGKKVNCIKWQHNIEYLNSNDKNLSFSDKEFCMANSTELDPPFPQWKNKSNCSGIFSIKGVDDILNMLYAVKNDIYGEVNLFVLDRQQKKKDLVSILSGKKEPNTKEILKNTDLIVDFIFSNDSNYQDCMVIKSNIQLEEFIENCVADFTNQLLLKDDRIEEIVSMKKEANKMTA